MEATLRRRFPRRPSLVDNLAVLWSGGFHGMDSVPQYLLALGIWYVALVIWWIAIELCRMAWGFNRG